MRDDLCVNFCGATSAHRPRTDSSMDSTPYALTELTVVLGTPTHLAAQFTDFQQRATAGANVTEHAWALHEYAALDDWCEQLIGRERTLGVTDDGRD